MKNIFITGGTSGIGLAIAKKYFKQGHRVGVCGRNKEKHQQSEILFYELNVTDRESVLKAIDQFSKEGLDILIASAGISYPHKTKIPDFERSYDIVNTNLLGTMYAFEGAINHFLKQGHGHLVGISSIAGLSGFPGVSAYSASKSAVIKLCESYAIDLKNENISVTCVLPGFVDTPLTKVNHHPMPFIVSSENAANKIIKGIEKKKLRIYFPFIFTFIIRLISLFPRNIYNFLMTIKILNFTKK